jgi:hypothetical protein
VNFIEMEFSPAAFGVHIFELDEHVFAVVCFDGGITACGLCKRGVPARGI